MDYHKIFKNRLWVEEINGAFIPRRFSRELMDFYCNISETISIRANCVAGIKMMFRMQGSKCTFEYRIGGCTRPSVYFDVYENGKFVESIIQPDGSKEGIVTYNKKTDKEAVIEIYLPHNCEVFISNLIVEGLDYVEDLREDTLVCFGDSITQGMDAKSPSKTYPVLLERSLNKQLLNQGVGGYIFDEQALGDLQHIEANYITVAYGTNDYTQIKDIEIIQLRVKAYMSRLKEVSGSAKVYIITPLWRSSGCDTEEEKEKFKRVGHIIAEEAKLQGFNVIDGLSIIPHSNEWFVDGLHPHEEGFLCYGENLLKIIKSQ